MTSNRTNTIRALPSATDPLRSFGVGDLCLAAATVLGDEIRLRALNSRIVEHKLSRALRLILERFSPEAWNSYNRGGPWVLSGCRGKQI